MSTNRGPSRALLPRLIGVTLALVLLATLAPSAGAVSPQEVAAAKARVEELTRQIEAAQGRLSTVQAEAAIAAEKTIAKREEYQAITAELKETRARLEGARERFADLQAQLDDRARQTYMDGPASSLEFLLGSSSISDLSDRLEFVGAVTQTDADLANEVQNLRNELNIDKAKEQELQARASAALQEAESQQEVLDAKVAEAQSIVNEIEAKKREAVAEAAKVSREYQAQITGQLGGGGGGGQITGNGVFRTCPVGSGHIVTNSFGAPRVGHLHAGNDIMAPYGTPIYAPFDGTASSSNSDLGGLQVYVYGSDGYVFNAHLSKVGASGHVSAGTVVGYVGNSGNASGGAPHDHFEWHPKVIPSNWPPSPYGYSVIGTAVNPYPLLVQVC